MSVQTLCQLCEAAPATHQCSRCAALVCGDHYVEANGLCTGCAAEVDERRVRE